MIPHEAMATQLVSKHGANALARVQEEVMLALFRDDPATMQTWVKIYVQVAGMLMAVI